MLTLKVISGSHRHSDGVTYNAGETFVGTEAHLVSFPNRFEAVIIPNDNADEPERDTRNPRNKRG